MGWDVPVVGQTTLGSGQTKALLEKPENWAKVYQNNFRPCSYDASGKLPARTAEFVDKLRANKIEMGDTLLWWIAIGYDIPHLVATAVREAGTDPAAITAYLNSVKNYPGVYGTFSWTAEQHNGYPDDEVVMCAADSFRDGAFNLAPGYSA
jgi:branched-chain amino acid transport system substrate-binding protein